MQYQQTKMNHPPDYFFMAGRTSWRSLIKNTASLGWGHGCLTIMDQDPLKFMVKSEVFSGNRRCNSTSSKLKTSNEYKTITCFTKCDNHDGLFICWHQPIAKSEFKSDTNGIKDNMQII